MCVCVCVCECVCVCARARERSYARIRMRAFGCSITKIMKADFQRQPDAQVRDYCYQCPNHCFLEDIGRTHTLLVNFNRLPWNFVYTFVVGYIFHLSYLHT